MQKSMTGFGKASATAEGKTFTVEIRSLNSKQMDLSVRIPQAYRQAEIAIRSIVAERLVRGKVDVTVSVTEESTDTALTIDRKLFARYVNEIREAATESGISIESYDSLVRTVMTMPNVVSTPGNEEDEATLDAIVKATTEAAEQLDSFRTQEGNTLIADMLRRVDLIASLRNDIEPYEKARTEKIQQRIREDIAATGIEVNSDRLEQEMIFYIEKLDITEEKVRLKNHCRYFHEVADNEPAAGRKLGFIAQEMGREINTTGSKANDTDIQIIVVKMKDELEKIKEQVLNLL